jgi:hypothetical protein
MDEECEQWRSWKLTVKSEIGMRHLGERTPQVQEAGRASGSGRSRFLSSQDTGPAIASGVSLEEKSDRSPFRVDGEQFESI